MRGPNKHDAFQARLDRLEQEGGRARTTAAPSPRAPSRPPAQNSKLWMALMFLCVLGGGAYAFSKFVASLDVSLGEYVKTSAFNALTTKPTPQAFDGLLSSGPKERKQSDTGWELPAPYVAAMGRSDLMLDEIAIASDTPQDAPSKPRSIAFSHNSDCTLRRPQAGEVVHNVTLEDTAHYTQTHTFSKAQLADAVADRIEGISKNPRHYKNGAIAKGRMGQVDVFVTDTSAPVYLVLQVFDKDMLWNIHLADGVTLAHVAMIGNKSGFAAPEGDHTFEALRIRDFVTHENLYQNEQQRPCMIAPWRKAERDWPLMGKQDDPHSASIYRDQLHRLQQGYAAYQQWYRGQLGVDPDTNQSTAIRAAFALAGPVPSTPVVHRPLEGRTIYLTQSDYVAFGDAELDALHVDLLMAAAGGDLASLTPPIQEATAP